MGNKFYGARLAGAGFAAGSKVLTNHDIAKLVDTNDEWIRERTGIVERRIVAEGETTTSLSIAAVNNLLDSLKTPREELIPQIDMVIVATSSPDYLFPSVAANVSAAIGSSNAFAFDMEAACSGFVYACITAHQYIKTGYIRKAIVIGADVLSKTVNWDDRGTCILFADGAGAVLLERSDEEHILGSRLTTIASDPCTLQLPVGTSQVKENWPSQTVTSAVLSMEGRKVYEFAIQSVPKSIHEVLAASNYKMEDIDYLVLHQANARITESVAKKLKLKPEQAISNIARYGNTSAATIPIALAEAMQAGTIKPGHRVMMTGFGAGLTVGTMFVKI